MYIQIDEEYLRKNKKRMNEIAKEELLDEEEAKDVLIDTDMEANVTIEEFNSERGTLLVTIDSELGYVSVEVPIHEDIAFEIVEWLKEKGEKLARLIRLSKNEIE